MVLEFLCNILFALAYFLVGLFPKFPTFSELNIDFSPVYYVVSLLNTFVSFRVLGVCAITILIVFNIKFVWSILMWLIRKIPGVS